MPSSNAQSSECVPVVSDQGGKGSAGVGNMTEKGLVMGRLQWRGVCWVIAEGMKHHAGHVVHFFVALNVVRRDCLVCKEMEKKQSENEVSVCTSLWQFVIPLPTCARPLVEHLVRKRVVSKPKRISQRRVYQEEMFRSGPRQHIKYADLHGRCSQSRAGSRLNQKKGYAH